MKKPSITIAIPAYNEEKNIQQLLRSIISQQNNGYTIKEIIVVSDGSTDKTVQLVQGIKDKRITLLAYKKRIGKSDHLNTIFKNAKGEIVVLFDADVVLVHKNVISHLIAPIKRDKNVGLVGGNPQPSKAETFIEEAINTTFYAYDGFRVLLKNGNSPFGCDGRILALSKKFAQSVHVPKNMIANDAFLYFSCITKGWSFRHVRKAEVIFRSPIGIKDQIRQNKRFIAARFRLQRIFGEIVMKEYYVPMHIKYRIMLDNFLKNPIHASVIFVVNKYCGYKAKLEEKGMNAKWQIAYSTKYDIKTYEK